MASIISPRIARGMNFGLIFFSSSEAPLGEDKYRLVLESARFADRHNFSSIWIPERHFTKDGWLYPNPAVLHAALARETTQIDLRAGSVVLPLHDPIRVAEEWAVVDNLSGGRVGLSIASGWHPNDFVFFPDNYEKRYEVMYRGIEMLKKLWHGESIQVRGGDGKMIDIRTYPTPIQPDIPIWMTAAGNPKTFAGAGEIGAHLLTHLYNQSIEQLAEKIQIYREALAKQGYDPQAGHVSVMMHTFVGEDADLVRQHVQGPFSNYLKSGAYLVDAVAQSRGQKVDMSTLSEQDLEDYLNFVVDRLVSNQRVLFGTPESCVETVARLKEAGVNEIACQLDFGIDLQLVLDSLPALNRLRELCETQLADIHAQSPTAEDIVNYAVSERAATNGTNGHAPVQGAMTPLDVAASSSLQDVQQRCREEVDVVDFYQRLGQRGVQLSTSFQGIEQLWRGAGEALGCVHVPDSVRDEVSRYQVHPTLLDACFQVVIATLPTETWQRDDVLYLPVGLSSFKMYKQPGSHVWSHALLEPGEHEGVFAGDVRIMDEAGQLLIEASGLQLQRTELAPAASPYDQLKDWLYELRWEKTDWPHPVQPDTQQPGKWLIFMDRAGVGRQLAAQLAAQGETCFGVLPGDAYSVVETGMYRVDVASVDDVERVLQDAARSSALPWHGVIHLWSLDATPSEQTTAQSIQTDQVYGAESALHVMQALARVAGPPRLWLVTSGAQPVLAQQETLAIAQSPLWGLGKTCAMEQPELWGGLIDVDPQASLDETAHHLLLALTATQESGKEDLLAVRQGQPYAARLMRSQDWTPRKLNFQPDASYLITGGLWGLGLEVARWMIEKGAHHLVLLGRTRLPEREQWDSVEPASRLATQIAGLRSLEQTGAHVEYVAVDVADEAQLRAFLQDYAREGHPPIKGVMHAASVWQDAQGQPLVRPLVNLDKDALRAVFKPKVLGGWLLQSLLQDTVLDFFVSFSSGASLFGSAAQGNYAAASEFLDALAAHQRARGHAAISIDWGAISEIGYGATADGQRVHEYWESRGIHRITPRQVLTALELLIPQSIARIGVIKLDWHLLREFFPQIAHFPLVRYLLAEAEERVPAQDGANGVVSGSALPHIQSALPAERQQLMISYLCEQLANVLRVPAHRLDTEQPLTALGLDSLMAIELKNRIERELQVRIPIVTFLQGPSITQFADQVLEQIAAPPVAEPALAAVAADRGQEAVDAQHLLSQLDQLSDTEVETLLSQMLQDNQSQPAEKTSNVSAQDAEQLLGQLDQLSDEDVDALLGEMIEEEDK